MRELKRIYLFIHAPAHLPYRELMRPNPPVEENWRKLVAEKGQDEESGICIIQGSAGDPELVTLAEEHFGERCVVDPCDEGPETMLLIAQDLEMTFRERGAYEQWLPYEMWSSCNARKWVEGLKKELESRGYSYDPEDVQVESFGNWTGCYHKYSMFMGRYLGLSRPVKKHPEPELSSLEEVPMKVSRFVEDIPLDHHVQLFVFEREDGRPMAQFFDGLRGIWEKPHIARVKVDPKGLELFTFSPNAFVKVRGASKILEDGFIADVGDGCHPAFTTVVGKDKELDEFRAALAEAEIFDLDEATRVHYRI